MPDLSRTARLVSRVIRDTFGPARYAPTVFRWWRLVVTMLAFVLALAGVSLPDHLRLSAAWWVAIFFAVVACLFAASAYRLHSTLDPEFPRHALTVGAIWYVDLEDTPRPGATTQVVVVPVSYVNREPRRRVILQFDLLWSRSVPGGVMGPYKLYPAREKPFLQSPVPVEPESMIPDPGGIGGFAFEADERLFEFRELMEVEVKENYVLNLQVTELVTEAVIERPVSGRAKPPALD